MKNLSPKNKGERISNSYWQEGKDNCRRILVFIYTQKNGKGELHYGKEAAQSVIINSSTPQSS